MGRFVDSSGGALSQDRIFCTDSFLSTNLSRSIGARQLSPTISCVPEIRDKMFKINAKTPFSIVMASDGVWDAVSSRRGINCARRRLSDPSKAALRIVTKAKEQRYFQGHRSDDITAIVIFASAGPRNDSVVLGPGGRVRRFFGGLCVSD